MLMMIIKSWELSLGFVALSIPTWVSPTRNNKDIHRHRVKYTNDDVHECIDYLVP